MLDPDVQSANPRVIKRYANRKLYDTRASRYVTLPQIAELVRSGEDVQIIDNRTKENLTSVTLAQIIYESEKSAEASTRQGVKTLRDLIQLGGEKLMAHFREGPVARFMPRAPDLPDFRELRERPRQMVAPALEALEELHRRADEKMRTLIGSVLAPVRELAHEVARLQARMEELEARLTNRREREGRGSARDHTEAQASAPEQSHEATAETQASTEAQALTEAPAATTDAGDQTAREETGEARESTPSAPDRS